MRVALISFHAHGDRSFLDDRELALAAGDLRDAGVPSDRVVAVIPRGEDAAIEERVIAALREYHVIVYERVFSRALIARLRAALPGATMIACDGEHAQLHPIADRHVRGDLRRGIAAAIGELAGASIPVSSAWRPNLRPRVIGEVPSAALRTFSIEGSAGCPWDRDARASPIYEGAKIPDGIGRGCAFCTTGNRYEPAPANETAARVIEKIRWVRAEAPEIRHLVLKDQSPFAWLEAVVAKIEEEALGPLTLMLETRVDWLLRNRARLERALAIAQRSGNKICPYLIGIESFSQPELDRFLKGVRAEDNIAFLETLDALAAAWGETLDLAHCSFGFVMFTPWTTLDDLRANHRAIVRTRFDRRRGALLASRARLYPDTALYWLAERDGLLAERWEHVLDDNATRYGYFPGHPWRFAEPRVARLAAIARDVGERTRWRDQVALLGTLLDAFESGREDALDVDALVGAVERGALTARAELTPA
jgi:hypothetical protein